MIARIEGMLEAVAEGSAYIAPGSGFTYEVLVPSYAVAQLAGRVGEVVTLHTLYYMDSQNQGSTIHPRLAGFLTEDDRDFFELFTTCKGIGNRKALRAMTLATEQIAAAIADRDVSILQSLPEVGKRTAETIVATLHGKVDRFASTGAFSHAPGSSSARDRKPAGGPAGGMGREALEVLMHLGENRTQAIAWIDTVLRDTDNRPADVEELVKRVYAVKAGG